MSENRCLMKMFVLILVVFFLGGGGAVIYTLNESQYAMMPPVIHLDPYEECLVNNQGPYCMAEFVLVSDQPSSVLEMIKEYSEHTISHFNHTKLRYGICVSQSCKKFYESERGDLKQTLEACLNESLLEKYELKVKILDEYFYCDPPKGFFMDLDWLDITVGIICVLLLIVNCVASLSEFFLFKNNSVVQNRAIRLLLSFSLHRNWNKLVKPFASDEDILLQRLQGLHGIRVITISLMIGGHAFLPCLFFIQNPKFIKEFYQFKPMYIFLNGTLIMQTFLMISSFLLVYYLLIYSEKHQNTWYALPMQVFKRWLRLTPPYAFVLALTATWFPRLATGPAWHKYIEVEMKDCRQYWWQNILFMNNLFNNSKCMLQCWYLATDIQLYILTVVVYLACKTNRSKMIVLPSLFIISMVIPAAYVYFLDLDGINLITPEDSLNLFITNRHFNYVYKRAETNIFGCVVGMAIGYLVYYLQQSGFRVEKYQSLPYRFAYWSLCPLATCCCYIGGVFYQEAPTPSLYVRTAYAAFLKPVFSLLIGGIIFGMVFKIEGIYRGVLEWSGWTVLSRLSYSAYLMHVVVVKTNMAAQTRTFPVDYVTVFSVCLTMLIVTYLAALVFWLLVDAPLSNITRELLWQTRPNKEKTKQN